MKRIIQIMHCASACLACTSIFAQSIERQVIASTGAVQTATGITLSSTSGEAVISNFSNSSIFLNQGFQQGDFIFTSLVEEKIHVNFKMYPNPTFNQVNLDLTSDKNMKGMVTISTIEGKQILAEEVILKAHQAFQSTYNLQNLSQGVYLLSIRGEDGSVQIVERIQKID